MAERIGLYGGSFNPVHLGHLRIARSVLDVWQLDRIVFLPSAHPPHKQQDGLVDAPHRAEMVKLAIAEQPRFTFSDFDLTRSGPSYTIDTIGHFRGSLGPEVELFWIIGADSLVELTTWRRAGELIDTCQIITAARPGWETMDWNALKRTLDTAQIASLQAGMTKTPLIDISSSDIRDRIRRGLPVEHLLPEAVLAYICQHGLYSSATC